MGPEIGESCRTACPSCGPAREAESMIGKAPQMLRMPLERRSFPGGFVRGLIYLLLILAVSGTARRAAMGAIPIGRGRLILDTVATIHYDSNLFANKGGKGGRYYNFVPTGYFEQDAGVVHVRATAGVSIGRFAEFEAADFENFQSNVSLSFPHREGAPGSFRFSGGYKESSRANSDVGARTHSHAVNFKAELNYAWSHKAVIRIDGAYNDVGFEAAGFGGQKTPQAGVRILYRYSPKLNWLVGYRYRDTESKGNSTISSRDSAFLVGLEGRTPGFSKVNGNNKGCI